MKLKKESDLKKESESLKSRGVESKKRENESDKVKKVSVSKARKERK